MSDSVWIRKIWRDTVWALLHNIRIRVTAQVRRPSVTIFGSGKTAGINILLPLNGEPGSAAAEPYDGPFAAAYNPQTGKLDVNGGWAFCNGAFATVPPARDIKPENGYLCVCAELTDGNWSPPEIRIATPAGTAHPIAEIVVDKDGDVWICQYPVTVAQIMTAKKCPLAEI